MLYSIDEVVVFGRDVTVPTSGTHTFKSILGTEMTLHDAVACVDTIRNRDRSIVTVFDQVERNIELGTVIIALWRDYAIRVGLGGQSLLQLSSMGSVIVALLSGCLYEAGIIIGGMPVDGILTQEIKDRFQMACTSADHITYA